MLLVVGVGTLLNTLAASSVTLALPQLGADLGIDVDRSRWVILAFLLAVATVLLLAGRVGDLLGHRRTYQGGFLLFGLSATVCGLAPSFALLAGARAFQGVGAAMLMATGPALLTTSFPPSQRGRALGIQATATYVGLTIGPPLGGMLLAALSWRWIFLINLPIAAVIITLGQLFLPRDGGGGRTRFDSAGTATLFVGLPLALLAVAEGPRWGATALETWLTAAAGGALLALFVAVERRSASPLLQLELFRSRVFTGAVLSALCNYVALFAPIILLPFYLLEGRRVGPAHAGVLLAVMPLAMALVASLAGELSDRVGTRPFSIAGMVGLAAGLAALSTSSSDTPLTVVGAFLAICGLGTGVFISPNSSALMGAAPRTAQGVAGGVMAIARTLGMMIGVALATAVFRAHGGQSGGSWQGGDYSAFGTAMLVAAAVAALGAATAALRGRDER